MLTREENDLLCRVENGAPMGELMKRHWTPVCMSEEVAEPDGKPIRLRILGEELVAFRDTEGRLAVMDGHCPHRGALLYLGRNEECAESIWPSSICAQLQGMDIFRIEICTSSLGAKGGRWNSGISSAGPR